MTDARGQSDLPTAFELLESVLLLITGGVLAAPMLPGFLLTVPALILFAVVVLAPLIAGAALVTLAAAILAIPYLLVRSIRSIRSRETAPAPESVSVAGYCHGSAAADTAHPRAAAASRVLG